MGVQRAAVLRRFVLAATVLASLGATAPAADDGAPVPQIESAALRRQMRAVADAGDFAGVLRAADDALRTDAASAVALEYRAFALHRLGRATEARDAYRALVRVAPDHAWGWTQLGAIELDLGRPDEARAALEKAVALAPSSEDAWKKLVRVHRARSDLAAALVAVDAATAAKADPAWCALEGATVAWAAGDVEDAGRRLDRAKGCGADAAGVANVERLVALDRGLSAPDRARRDRGEPWRIATGPFVVETLVGPTIPAGVQRVLTNATALYPEFLGVKSTDGVELKLALSRTIEEHEAVRRLSLPGSASGTAFTTEVARADGRELRAHSVRMHVAWPQSGFERSIAHETAHAFLRLRTPGIPPWLDEAVATYLEGVGLGEAPGAPREDLVRTLTDARVAGRLFAWEGIPMAGAPSFQGPGARLHYAQAWLILHWMLHAEGAPGRDGLRRLLDEGRGWTAARDALARVLGRPWTDVAPALDAHLDRLAKVQK